MRRPACLLGFVLLAGLAPAVSAQDGPALLRRGLQAFNEFDNATALPLLRRGLSPAAGPQDSLWARSVQSLAQIMFDEGQPDLVRIWARFGMRHVPDMRFDSLNVIGEVLDAFTAARAEVAATADDQLATTEWLWPAGDLSGTGRIVASLPALPQPATALVVGRGVIGTPGMSLPPGVYRIQVTAQGYRDVEVTREVLPGVTTAVRFDLSPARMVAEGTLAPATREQAIGNSVGLLATRFGRTSPACGAGMIVGRNGMMLTTYRAIRGATRLEAVVQGRRITEGIRVAAYDVAADLAVLTLPVVRNDSALLASSPTAGAHAWRVGRMDCGPAEVTDTRIAAQGGRAAGMVYTTDSLANSPTGTPFVSEGGALIGLWTGPLQLVPAERARALLDRARQVTTTQTVAEVGGAEGHLYGSMEITATLSGVTGRVSPLAGAPQWPELTQVAPLPMIFTAPAGQYQVQVLMDGNVRRTEQFTIRAGVADNLTVRLEQIAAGPPPVLEEDRQGGGGGFPWIIAALGGVGAGVAALVLLGGGEGGGGTTGGITVRVPNR